MSSKIYIFVAVQLLRKIAFPISLVYALVVRLRNILYDTGVLTSKSFKTPTICIGNLSVGGTGKTPMVEYLISELINEHRIAVLSRGYRRKSNGFVRADDNSTVGELGDESFQIHTKFPEIAVAVDGDRCNGISVLEDTEMPDLILLDDAFQHRKVKAGLYILLTAYGKLYADDWYLPTGNLRDSKREANRADLIVVTKCPPDLSESERREIATKLKPAIHQKVLFSCLEYDDHIKGEEMEDKSLDFFQDNRASLVTGIADPTPLLGYLKKAGVKLEHLRFKDHHFFTGKELAVLNSKPVVLTTEKDFARLRHKVKNLYFIGIKHKFLGGDAQTLKEEIRNFMKRDS